ncbi:hypothetical protein DJ79_05690 [Halorubrum ezzemoulense]|uniref:Archaeal Type IV pilin N-terminal domain-containing protein n=1 Tax=Halorubrum ezzemoulense TaxID=337243 RepID=A0A256JIP5_HALEZ|nr:type IV pilin N-terminal domain-containing protein [Halorubrum ezzemoulense]OYR68416.1 hypothetical protein DJ79_05690 [Halorubrum ezzemoulense]
MSQQDRAVTPVISTILVVAIVVILAATVSVAFLGITENLTEPAPIVGDTTGELIPGGGENEQVVQITHVAGDSIAVEEIEIIVRVSGSGSEFPKEARLVNLPSDGPFPRSIDNDDIQGDNLVDSTGGQFTSEYNGDQIIVVDDSNIWTPSDTIQFRLNSGDEGVDFSDGDADELEVVIVHKPSNAIISEHTFRP